MKFFIYNTLHTVIACRWWKEVILNWIVIFRLKQIFNNIGSSVSIYSIPLRVLFCTAILRNITNCPCLFLEYQKHLYHNIFSLTRSYAAIITVYNNKILNVISYYIYKPNWNLKVNKYVLLSSSHLLIHWEFQSSLEQMTHE